MGPARPPPIYSAVPRSACSSSKLPDPASAVKLLEDAFELPLTPHHLAVALFVQSCAADCFVARSQFRRPFDDEPDAAAMLTASKLALAQHLITHADTLAIGTTDVPPCAPDVPTFASNLAGRRAAAPPAPPAGVAAPACLTLSAVASALFQVLPPAQALATSRVIASQLAALSTASSAVIAPLGLAPPPPPASPEPAPGGSGAVTLRSSRSMRAAACVPTAASAAPLQLLMSAFMAQTDAESTIEAYGASPSAIASMNLPASAAAAAALAAGAPAALSPHPFHVATLSLAHTRARAVAAIAGAASSGSGSAFPSAAAVADAADDVAAAAVPPLASPFVTNSLFSGFFRLIAGRFARLTPARAAVLARALGPYADIDLAAAAHSAAAAAAAAAGVTAPAHGGAARVCVRSLPLPACATGSIGGDEDDGDSGSGSGSGSDDEDYDTDGLGHWHSRVIGLTSSSRLAVPAAALPSAAAPAVFRQPSLRPLLLRIPAPALALVLAGWAARTLILAAGGSANSTVALKSVFCAPRFPPIAAPYLAAEAGAGTAFAAYHAAASLPPYAVAPRRTHRWSSAAPLALALSSLPEQPLRPRPAHAPAASLILSQQHARRRAPLAARAYLAALSLARAAEAAPLPPLPRFASSAAGYAQVEVLAYRQLALLLQAAAKQPAGAVAALLRSAVAARVGAPALAAAEAALAVTLADASVLTGTGTLSLIPAGGIGPHNAYAGYLVLTVDLPRLLSAHPPALAPPPAFLAAAASAGAGVSGPSIICGRTGTAAQQSLGSLGGGVIPIAVLLPALLTVAKLAPATAAAAADASGTDGDANGSGAGAGAGAFSGFNAAHAHDGSQLLSLSALLTAAAASPALGLHWGDHHRWTDALLAKCALAAAAAAAAAGMGAGFDLLRSNDGKAVAETFVAISVRAAMPAPAATATIAATAAGTVALHAASGAAGGHGAGSASGAGGNLFAGPSSFLTPHPAVGTGGGGSLASAGSGHGATVVSLGTGVAATSTAAAATLEAWLLLARLEAAGAATALAAASSSSLSPPGGFVSAQGADLGSAPQLAFLASAQAAAASVARASSLALAVADRIAHGHRLARVSAPLGQGSALAAPLLGAVSLPVAAAGKAAVVADCGVESGVRISQSTAAAADAAAAACRALVPAGASASLSAQPLTQSHALPLPAPLPLGVSSPLALSLLSPPSSAALAAALRLALAPTAAFPLPLRCGAAAEVTASAVLAARAGVWLARGSRTVAAVFVRLALGGRPLALPSTGFSVPHATRPATQASAAQQQLAQLWALARRPPLATASSIAASHAAAHAAAATLAGSAGTAPALPCTSSPVSGAAQTIVSTRVATAQTPLELTRTIGLPAPRAAPPTPLLALAPGSDAYVQAYQPAFATVARHADAGAAQCAAALALSSLSTPLLARARTGAAPALATALAPAPEAAGAALPRLLQRAALGGAAAGSAGAALVPAAAAALAVLPVLLDAAALAAAGRVGAAGAVATAIAAAAAAEAPGVVAASAAGGDMGLAATALLRLYLAAARALLAAGAAAGAGAGTAEPPLLPLLRSLVSAASAAAGHGVRTDAYVLEARALLLRASAEALTAAPPASLVIATGLVVEEGSTEVGSDAFHGIGSGSGDDDYLAEFGCFAAPAPAFGSGTHVTVSVSVAPALSALLADAQTLAEDAAAAAAEAATAGEDAAAVTEIAGDARYCVARAAHQVAAAAETAADQAAAAHCGGRAPARVSVLCLGQTVADLLALRNAAAAAVVVADAFACEA